MSLRDLILGTVPDPIGQTGPAVLADHPHDDHRGAHVASEAFTQPDQHVVAEARHGGPGSMHAVPVELTAAGVTVPMPAARWASGQVAVPDFTPAGSGGVGNAVQVIGRDPFRRGLTMTNTGTQVAWVAPTREQAQPGSGFPIAAGGTLTLDTAAPVWATSTAGSGGTTLAWAFTADAADR